MNFHNLNKNTERYKQGIYNAWDKSQMHKKILIGNTERKRYFGRSRHKWKNNIKMDPRIIYQQ